jgi:hypothetical protein
VAQARLSVRKIGDAAYAPDHDARNTKTRTCGHMGFFPQGYVARNASTFAPQQCVVSAVAAAVCLPLIVRELGLTCYADWAAL